MLAKALNHITAPGLEFGAFLTLARDVGCAGVELRNDLARPLFDGAAPAKAARMAKESGLEIFAVAELKAFNDWSAGKEAEALALIEVAQGCGARGISLIPRNDGYGTGNGERQANLRIALRELTPMLDAHGLMGFVEPLGFEHCSLRDKSEAVEIVEAIGASARIQLVHDTFHHHLAGGGPVFAQHTGMVHVSGVSDADISVREMADGHRVLVDQADRLGNVAQIEEMMRAGYAGPISMEAFAPSVQSLADPRVALTESFSFIASRLAEKAA